jgi:hypothetical protein
MHTRISFSRTARVPAVTRPTPSTLNCSS